MTSDKARRIRTATTAGVAAVLLPVALSGPAAAATTGVSVPAGFSATVFAASDNTAVTGPDDIAKLGDTLFVGYQNGVGSQGEPAPSGQTRSTVVAYDKCGKKIASWNLTGKVDGLGADPTRHRVIATVNEDGNSSLYTITLDGSQDAQVQHYQYQPNPLPHGGGTDSVVVRHGTVYITASNPAADANGTTYSRPALYRATLADGHVTLTPVLLDNSVATDAVTGKQVTLNLSDPDSSEIVPHSVPRFGGDLLLDSQGDSELIFVAHPGRPEQKLTVLPVADQLDDTAFASSTEGTLYAVDNKGNRVIAIHGPFRRGEAFTSGSTLDTLNLGTGAVTTFATGVASKGLLFVDSED